MWKNAHAVVISADPPSVFGAVINTAMQPRRWHGGCTNLVAGHH